MRHASAHTCTVGAPDQLWASTMYNCDSDCICIDLTSIWWTLQAHVDPSPSLRSARACYIFRLHLDRVP